MSNKKIAIIAANGNAGKLIAQEAVSRGMDVTAVVRGENRSAAQHVIVEDAFNVTARDLVGFDAVVCAFGAWTPETIGGIGQAIIHIGKCLEGMGTHYIVVGGAGSLYVDAEHAATVDQGPDFPDDWKPLSASHGVGLAWLRSSSNLDWTYVSPACDFQADGKRTGEYTLAGEELALNAAGESTVSYADYAIAMVDLIEAGAHRRERVSVVSK